MRRIHVHAVLLALIAMLPRCGENDSLSSTDPFRPYVDNAATVIDGDESTEMPVATGQVTEEGCLQVTADECVPVSRDGRYCKSDTGPVDVVVVDGEVQEVVCYEDTDGAHGPSVVVDGDHDGDVDVPQQDNGAVITFDQSTDGTPFAGNMSVDGNNVTIYGNGPDKTIIEGDLIISGNNARVRGVRIKGNVTIELNTAALVFAVVEGNLTVTSNNSLIAEVDVFGDLTASGNNTVLVNDRVAGEWRVTGGGAVCSGNVTFADEDRDFVADEGEGEALTCPM